MNYSEAGSLAGLADKFFQTYVQERGAEIK
jgi:hypothetical protein